MHPSTSSKKLERELKQAQDLGRWLSDEERLELEEQELSELRMIEQQRNLKLRLILLTLICVLIPPLWGLAAGLSFYLLFPETSKRVAWIAGGGLIVATLLMTLLVGALVLLLANLIF